MMETKRARYQRRFGALKNERSTWIDHWRDLSDFILPRRGRFLLNDRNRGTKRNDKIINNTATVAARTLASGMMSGITSPARPWFRLITPDPDLSQSADVKSWLRVVEERMRIVFARSNLYNGLAGGVYPDLGVFGTSVMIVEEDVEDVIRCYSLPVGSYCLGASSRGQVDTLYREVQMTTAQVVEKFGLATSSLKVREAYERGDMDIPVDIIHVVEPNRDWKPGMADRQGKRFASCWYEQGADGDTFLRESGYNTFPAMCPRWSVTGEDAYGSSPAMDALGDIKAIQQLERRKASIVDKTVNPPMVGPSSLKRASLLPGDFNAMDATGQRFEPAVVMPPQALGAIEAMLREHENRVNSTLFADLMLMLSQSDRTQITAREVDERHEEKMLQLGPVMERLGDELLDPIIDRTFDIMMAAKLLPPPPKELEGVELRVEYISVMAQAQKMLSVSGIERGVGFVGNLAAAKPEALDKLNVDKIIDEYFDSLGVKPDLVNTQDMVDQARAGRAQQQQAAMQQQQMLAAAQGAKTLSEADTSGPNALTQMISSLTGGVPGGNGGVA